MLTLSLVDIDRDAQGDPQSHFLIKRAVGVGGDWFIADKGNMRLRPAGESQWIEEKEFFASRGWTHNLTRLMEEGQYPALEAWGRAQGYRDLGLQVPSSLQALVSQAGRIGYPDYLAREKARLEFLRGAYPHERRYSVFLARHNQGIYVPETRILPLGDNRDNSRDGRYFGPIMKQKMLGKGWIVYWPGDLRVRRFAALERFGAIK
jgi:signal peptidase I